MLKRLKVGQENKKKLIEKIPIRKKLGFGSFIDQITFFRTNITTSKYKGQSIQEWIKYNLLNESKQEGMVKNFLLTSIISTQ